MIKRYPHTATVTIETLSGGPMPTVTTEDITIPGRYEPAMQPGGGSLDYSAKYYCDLVDILKQDPHALDGKKMQIFGREIGISKAWNFQIHCEIWLD